MARKSFISFTAVIIISLAGEGDNQLTQISGCVCAGHDVTFTCSIVGGGNTIWNGTAFDCPSPNSVFNNQIFLRHSEFQNPGATSRECNGGDIVGEGVSVQGTRYTSQLNVSVNSDTVGKTVSCIYDDIAQARETLIGVKTIELTSGDELSQPSDVSLVRASPSELEFRWSSVTHDCSALLYNIMMTNPSCGSCPTIINSTTTTCSIQPLQPNDIRVCTFQVQGVVCGNGTGPSGEANFTLQVPDVPVVRIVPTYSGRERTLLSLHVTIMKLGPFSISTAIDGSAMFYNINYTNSTSGELCGSAAIPTKSSSCTNDLCTHEFNISTSLCSPSTALSVVVFASNILGDGVVSEELTFDEINNFVNVSFDAATKHFMCKFTNKQDFSEKTCSITLYRGCKEEQIIIDQANSTDSQITLVLDSLQSETSVYCYIVAASNETLTLNLTGSIGQTGTSPSSSMRAAAITVGVLVPIVIIAIVSLIIGVAVVLYYYRKGRGDSTDGASLIPVKDDRFMELQVKTNCDLKPFIEAQDQTLTYQMGAAFYEFTRAEEDIHFNKEVVFMDKKTTKLYTGKAACDRIGAPGEGIKKPKLRKYRVFVQSQGIGCRPLESNSLVLYERNRSRTDTNKTLESERFRVDSGRFQQFKVTEDCELQEFIESHCKLPFKPGCAFFEFINDEENISEKKEVLVMDKNTGDIFTGPGVLSMLGAPGRAIKRPSLGQWRVFIQSMYGARLIHKDSTLLYQNLGSGTEILKLEDVDPERLEILDVDKTCSIGDFVKNNNLGPYNPRRFFFEFVRKIEEITDDKEIILMEKDTQKMFTGSKAKEMIKAPAKEVKKPSLEKYRVFVQNGGGDARCLKKDTKLLYERKYYHF